MIELKKRTYLGQANAARGGGVVESLEITPSTTEQTIMAPAGIDGYNPIVVSPVTSEIDANIKAENIKNNVTILGVTGTHGSDHGGKYLVRVVDYDGTLLKEDHLNTGDVFELPETPSHSRLVFEEWSSSEEIVENTVTVGNSNILIGPIYTTASEMNEFDIEVNEVTGLTVEIYITNAEIDWGDGGGWESWSSDTPTHTYAAAGAYTIKCNGTKSSSSTSGIFTNGAILKNAHIAAPSSLTFSTNYLFAGNENLESITFSTGTIGSKRTGTYLFQNCHSLKTFICPNGVKTVQRNSFEGCYNLENLVIVNTVTAIQATSLSSLYSMKQIAFPAGITSVHKSAMEGLYSLEAVVFPDRVATSPLLTNAHSLKTITFLGNITSIPENAYTTCETLREIDFTNCTQVPSITGTPFYENTGFMIKVPEYLYDTWVATSGWDYYASHIVAV